MVANHQIRPRKKSQDMKEREHEKDIKYSTDYITKLICVISAVVKVLQSYLESITYRTIKA